jgi:hypothetical protein
MRRPWPTGGCRAKDQQTTRDLCLCHASVVISCCVSVVGQCALHSESDVWCARARAQCQVQIPAGKPVYVLSKNVFLISHLNKPQQG